MKSRDATTTLVHVLQRNAAVHGNKRAYTALGDGPNEEHHITWAELDAQARAIGAKLQETVPKGARALLLYPPGIDYVAGFFGCLYAGVIAVPAYPPLLNRMHVTLPRLLSVVADARATVVLTTAPILMMTEMLRGGVPELNGIPWLASDTLPAGTADAWKDPAVTASDLAFLQYTSGSTGNPKGVMLSHKNLIANLAFSGRVFAMSESSVFVSWLPPYHDMGLIGIILGTAYNAAFGVLMSPISFLQKPLRWLDAVSRFRGTISAAPNFAYDLCTRRITDEQIDKLDLSSWTMTVNGAEPVKADTVAAFNARFARAGLRVGVVNPSYGLAEATLLVSGSTMYAPTTKFRADKSSLEKHEVAPAKESGGIELVASGVIDDAMRVRIVDPQTLRPVAENRVGEIWVCGDSVSSGYWEKPELSKEIFHATIDGDGPFLRTGDLGFTRDGQLFITGRQKDVMIIRGRNLYPQDVESTVDALHARHPQIKPGCGAAFSVVEDGEERLIVVQEVERRLAAKPFETERRGKPFRYREAPKEATFSADEVAASIATAISVEHGVAVHRVVLLRPSSLPKTSSGKIQRSACKKSYQSSYSDGVLEVIAAVAPEAGAARDVTPVVVEPPKPVVAAAPVPRTAAEITSFLQKCIAEALGTTEATIDPKRPFAELGLDSASAVAMTGDLADFVGVHVSANIIWEKPSIEKLAEHLGTKSEVAESPYETSRDVSAHEPIAIVGMACRFPGADGVAEFKKLLVEGRSAITEVPNDRWDGTGLLGTGPGKTSTRFGAFLDAIDQFDADHFAISPREAGAMDPQQRLLLEVSWHALEDAGVSPARARESRTGVFVGISSSDYAKLSLEDIEKIDFHTGTGNAHSVAANRLSYALDLRGPSMAVDTACSSSLVAVHLACQSLRSGESDSAIAAGVNVILTPELTVAFSRARMLAQDGKCKTFDALADGYVRGEGCGVLVLKRLSDALRDGDRVHAVIRGSAVNQDGKSNGLTAPNGFAQRAVVRTALDDAGLEPRDVGLVEAHGTGTPLGDPIEVEALGAVLGEGRERPWLLGSVKTNIGHLEAAAGIAGLVKAVLSVEESTIFPHLNFSATNPRIDLAKANAEIPTTSRAWPAGPRIAGVSSFGFGGTNAHVIVEAPPARAAIVENAEPRVLALSARSATALDVLVDRFAARLSDARDWGNITRASVADRAPYAHRIAIVAESASAAREILVQKKGDAFAKGFAESTPRVAFMFTGQGSQWAGMGKELYDSEPVFRDVIDACANVLDRSLAVPLRTVMFGADEGGSRIDDTRYTQPALFAFEVALAELWRSWGVVPGVVLGHSVGEIAACCFAGALSLEDALRFVEARSRLMGALPTGGTMAAVMGADDIVERVARANGVAIAGYNAPQSLVVSGRAEDVARTTAALEKEGITSQPLVVSHAFHSPLMEPMLAELERVLQRITFHTPKIPVISNVTGEKIDRLEPKYWLEHTTGPVRFRQGVERAAKEFGLFLEIGPKPILSGLVKRTLGGKKTEIVSSLRPPKKDRVALASAVAKVWTAGVNVDERAWPVGDRRVVDLPLYPFERRRHWLETEQRDTREAKLHPLLDARATKSATEVVYTKRFTANDAVIAQHVVENVAILPGVAYLEMAIAAARHELAKHVRVQDVVISMPLMLGSDGSVVATVTLAAIDGKPESHRFTIASGNVTHATGIVSVDEAARTQATIDVKSESLSTRHERDAIYAAYSGAGIAYGDFFRLVRWVKTDGTDSIARLESSEDARRESGFLLHPAIVDASLQSFGMLVFEPGKKDLYVPFSIDAVDIHGALPRNVIVRASRVSDVGEVVRGDVVIADETGKVVVEIRGLAVKRVRRDRSIAKTPSARASAMPAPQTRADLRFDGRVAIITGAGNGLGRAHALLLASRGCKVVVNDLGCAGGGAGSSSSAADRVVSEIKAAGGEAIASYDSVEDGEKIVQAALDAWGRIDIVVNNAGILRDAAFGTMTDEAWDIVHRVHVRGAYKVTRAAWNALSENGGHVIFTTSAVGLYGSIGQANYAAAKAAIVGLANALAVEGRRSNIRVNTISPVAGSRLTESVLPKELRPEYVSPLVAWLCHDRCDETGGLFEVGGGVFTKTRLERTEGQVFALDGTTLLPEHVRDTWRTIVDFDRTTHPPDVTASVQPILENLETAKSSGTAVIEELAKELRPVVTKHHALYGLGTYGGFRARIDEACAAYVIAAFANLGFDLARCGGKTIAELRMAMNVIPRHERLFARLVEILVLDGRITVEGDRIRCAPAKPVVNAGEAVKSILEDFPACEAELAMLERCASRLSEVLTGACEPLTLLFPAGSLGAAEALYQDSPFSRFYNTIVQTVVSALVAREKRRPLRILEIGAGTGGTTAYVVPKLPAEGIEYVFSDVSRVFLGKAEKKFGAHSFMRYEVLDIENDPTTQGFDPHSFDIIIAANVLHATLDLEATLRHAKSLLSRDGSIVVLENTAKQSMLDLIFGLTEGWWRYTDTSLRADYALLPQRQWKDLFERVGFRAACAFPSADKAIDASEQAVLVARGIDAPVTTPVRKAALRPAAPVAQPAAAKPLVSTTSDLDRFAMDRVVAEVARSLRQDPQQIAVDRNFLDLGLDSLMAVEIVASLKEKLGVSLAATILFEHTTIEALSTHLASKFAPELRAALSSAEPTLTVPSTPPPPVVVAPEPVAPIAPPSTIADTDIAVIGMGCNFPNSPNLDAFWRSLVENKDCVAEIPKNRWDTSGVSASKHAALLERLDLFDAQFFEIAPREARLIDPQQRMMLEVVWETIEHAGYGGQLFGKDVGVFVGSSNTDYFDRIRPHLAADDYAAGLGNKTFIIPNRVSYFMNWRGPSVLVDTACSSSLVALQQAVEALRRGECSYAIVGGVNVLLSASYYEALQRMGVQAPDGRCKAFDHHADGFVTGEGAGAILLKPAKQAIADGDTVYAIIKGAAVNHNGKSAGLVAPNPAAHAEVIARAYDDAKISADSVSYVEAHGTGTALGDVIEMQGLTMAFRRFTERKRFCTLGSVKTNIGHLEPAAGIASVIKVILSMANKTIPGTLHFEKENPGIAWNESPFVVRSENIAWSSEGPRRAGVSSFGMGGTNAHVVLEEAPAVARPRAIERKAWVLPLSARTDAALKALAARYEAWLRNHPEAELGDVCFTAATGRAAMRHRVAVVGNREEILVQLARIASADDVATVRGIFYGVVKRRATGVRFESHDDPAMCAKAFVDGADIASSMGGGARMALPTYPFERQSHWMDNVEGTNKPPSKAPPPVHPFLIKRLS